MLPAIVEVPLWLLRTKTRPSWAVAPVPKRRFALIIGAVAPLMIKPPLARRSNELAPAAVMSLSVRSASTSMVLLATACGPPVMSASEVAAEAPSAPTVVAECRMKPFVALYCRKFRSCEVLARPTIDGVERMPLALAGAPVLTRNFSFTPRSVERFDEMIVIMPAVERVSAVVAVRVEVTPVPLVSWTPAAPL